jgi:rare lipoprotein A
MRPYVIKYKRYTPHLVRKGTKQYGVSSWYGPNFHGKYTSNGEVYDMHARTAAHKTFPMDTIVRVTNRENGRSTVVRINDRGPFVTGRIIDCSYRAGKEIGLDTMGIAKVEVEVLGMAKLNKYKQAIIQKRKQVPVTKTQQPRLIGIQLGAYSVINGAYACKRRYMNRYVGYKPIIKKLIGQNGTALYRVWLVGFKTRQELEDFKSRQNQLAERI